MTEPLSAERLDDMRSDHIKYNDGCLVCYIGTVDPASGICEHVPWPCSTALLLAELDRREANPPRWQDQQPVPHLALLAGVHDGLCGPRSAEDLC